MARKIKSTPFPDKNGKSPFNASGVAQVGARRFVFIDNRDPGAFFEFTLDDGHVDRIRRRRLDGVTEGQWHDPEGLTRVDMNSRRLLVATSSLSVAGTDSSGRPQVRHGLVRVRYAPDGDLAADIMPGFRSWLLAQLPGLTQAGERKPDAGGLNIEGLAWDPRAGTLLFGQRSPAAPGRVSVIRVPVDIGASTWTTASLQVPTVSRLGIPHSTGTQGIRDISYDEWTGQFLIVLGRSISGGDEQFQLCTWDGSSDEVRLIDVEFHRSMKPEGVTAFQHDDRQQLLIVDDRGGYAVLDAPGAQ